MGNTYMPKPENRYPNNVSGFEHIWELDMLNQTGFVMIFLIIETHKFYFKRNHRDAACNSNNNDS